MINYDKKMESQKKEKKGFWATKFEEFCKRTDLHGYKYIVMEDLSAFERICWMLTIIVSIAVAAYFVVTAYKWYARNPIVTVIESTQGAVWDVPFPAVTICDLNLVSRKSAYNLSISISLPGDITSDEVLDSLRLAPLLHTPYAALSEQKEQLKLLQLVLDHNNMSIESLFEKISPVDTCNNLVERCMWKNAMLRCDKLFTPIFTMWNQCCTFNYFAVNLKETDKSIHSEDSPRRVASCGYQTALSILLRIEPDDYFSTYVSSQGTMVIIDSAYNFPTQASPARVVNPSTEVMIALSPERTYATSGIKLFSPEQRQCYYIDELKLDGFRQYSLHNCMTTQRVSIFNKTCGCIPFYFPSHRLKLVPINGMDLYPAKVTSACKYGMIHYDTLKFIGYQRSCTFKDMDCLDNAHKIIKEELNSNRKICLAECEHFDYLIEIAMGKLSKNADVKGLPFFKDIELANRSLLNVFFNDLVSTRYRRDVYLNWQNILAAFGGLLGLMLGFTLISGFDVLLFTVRVLYQSLVDHLPERLTKIHSEKIEVDSKKRVNHWIDQSIRNQMVASDYNKWGGVNKVYNGGRY